MAINRIQYPITFAEAIRTLRDLAEEIGKDAAREERIGDPRPEILGWAANRLARLEFAAMVGERERDAEIARLTAQYKDAFEHAKIWRERAERAEASLNGEQNKPETFRESETPDPSRAGSISLMPSSGPTRLEETMPDRS